MIRREGRFLNTRVYDDIFCSYRRWKSPHRYDQTLRSHHLTVKVVFECYHLGDDSRVVPGGATHNDCLLEFSKLLSKKWDGKTIVSLDDPELAIFKAMEMKGLIDLSLLPHVGAEMFSAEMYNWFKVWLTNSRMIEKFDVKGVEVMEHRTTTSMYTDS